MKLSKVDYVMGGFMTAAAVGFALLPVAVFTHTPPHVWGSLAIGAMPFGALIGLLAHWVASAPADDEEPQPPRQRSREKPIIYDPSDWTGRHP